MNMGVASELKLNGASYSIMMWLKQGPSEPDEAIIMGQFIDTSTTTTTSSLTATSTSQTSTSATSTSATSTSSSSTQTTTLLGAAI